MNTENTKKLFEKYPIIFGGHTKPLTESLMGFGFECGDGWYWLIDNLCDSIQSYLTSNAHKDLSPVVAVQVKEKFGELRFYHTGGDDIIFGMVWLAESLSNTICEECGSTEHVGQTSGWIMTRCKQCVINSKIQNWKEHNA